MAAHKDASHSSGNADTFGGNNRNCYQFLAKNVYPIDRQHSITGFVFE